MQVHYLSEKTDVKEKALEECVLSIGNFDGCHLGHQALIRELVASSKKSGLKASVLTFDPHPRAFFNSENFLGKISTLSQKLHYFKMLGVDTVCVQNFDAQFCRMSPLDFVHCFLFKTLKVRKLFAGKDFRFGFQKKGDLNFLEQQGVIQVQKIDKLLHSYKEISSTLVRKLVVLGDVEQAEKCLGRPYCLLGFLESGNQIGRKIGFPTLNLGRYDQILPRNGVYFGCVDLGDGEMRKAIFNVGVRPTVESFGRVVVEGHLLEPLEFGGNLADKPLKFCFLKYCRDEKKFRDISLLRDQIAKDVLACKKYFETRLDF